MSGLYGVYCTPATPTTHQGVRSWKSCAKAVEAKHGLTISHERARQIGKVAMEKIKAAVLARLYDEGKL